MFRSDILGPGASWCARIGSFGCSSVGAVASRTNSRRWRGKLIGSFKFYHPFMNWARTCLQDGSEYVACDNGLKSTQPKSVHFPWKFVSSQLKNSKGEEIPFPVNDEQDRRWARRLEWVIEEHLDRAEDDLDKLQADYEAVLRRSQEAHERRYDRAYISDLTKRLDAANKSLRHFHLYGHMQ